MANQVFGQALSDIPALKPYRGKLAVRNFRGGDGNVGIIRSPVRAIALPDSRMADRLFSRVNIKRRAFSWRPARSSMVMGLASPRSVRSAAMAGGRDLSPSAAWASVGKATLTPAAREPVCRKRRREIMNTRRMENAFCRLADG